MATTEAYAAYNNIPKAEMWEMLQEREQRIIELEREVEKLKENQILAEDLKKNHEKEIIRIKDRTEAVRYFCLELIEELIWKGGKESQ